MSDRNQRLLRLASTAAVVTATLLIVAKGAAWVATGSVSLLASLIDSLLDVAASTINLFAIRYALQPPDEEHRFGHGKAEPIAGLAQSAFILGSAFFLLLRAGERLWTPAEVTHTTMGIAVMLFSIVATAVLVAIQRRVIRETNSTAIRADSLHYVADILANAGVLLALLGVSLGWHWADPILAIVIGLYIAYTAWHIWIEAFQELMDRELPEDEKEKVRAIALAHPLVEGLHELRTRRAGQRYLFQLHIEINGELTLNETHVVAEEVEKALKSAYPGADVITHQDPAGLVEDGQRRD